MRYATALLVLLFSATAYAADATATVKQLERSWLDAYETRDVAAMERIVADGFTITFSDGSVETKEQVVESIRKARERGGKPPKFHTEQTQAHQFGDVVVLTGVVVTEWTKKDGTAGRASNRYTDTYVRFGDEWRVVSSHLSNVKESGEKK
jgi:ketosteroid isomerase-like protein